MKERIALFVILFFTLSIALPAQNPAETPEQNYMEGKLLFECKHYSAARQALGKLKNTRSLSGEMIQEAEYIMACSTYELKEEGAYTEIAYHLKKYPYSLHANRLKTLLANILYERKEYDAALRQYEQCEPDDLNDSERDEATLNQAICHLNVGNTQKAYTLFSVLLMCSEEYQTSALFYKAYIDYTYQRFQEASPVFKELLGNPNYRDKSMAYLADISLTAKEYPTAYRLAKDYLREYPDGEAVCDMTRIAGEARYGENDFMEANELLTHYLACCPTPKRNALYKSGICHYKQGNYSQAAPLFTQAAGEPDALTQNAYLHSGLSYVQLKETNKARMAFEQASAMNFDKAIKEQALYNYALCIHETAYSGFGESVLIFERFLNEYPHSVYRNQVNDYLIEVYMNTRSYKTALASIAKIQKPDTRILEAKQKILYRLGTEAFANSNFQEAESYFTQSLKVGIQNSEVKANAFFWRGEARYKQANWQGAANDYRQYLGTASIKETTLRNTTYYNLGYTSFHQQKYPQALNYFRAVQKEALSSSMQADLCNRIGDCHFYNRNFKEALTHYNQATTLEPSMGDYPLFQAGFIEGLQKNYPGKIALLESLILKFPQSNYIDDALYEQGRAYVQLERNTQAIETFQQLVKQFPESVLASKAANEIGLLHYQDDRFEEAILAYKQVITNYAGSEEARLALRDLKSVYVDLNRIDEYARYVSSLNGYVPFNHNEHDSLTYVAAEKIYLRGDTQEARNSFNQYLQQFPQGNYCLNAHYYLGMIEYHAQNTGIARKHLDKVLEYPNNKFSEEALIPATELAYKEKDYSRALTLYKLLKGKTTSNERIELANTGILRTAYLTQSYDDVLTVAKEILNNPKSSSELKNETRYYRCRSLISQGKKGEAIVDLQELAKDTRNIYGAEAKYRIAEMYYSENRFAEAEKELLNYIEVSTPHSYWLARSFVLLADVYIKTDRKLEAKQYLLSLQQNYNEKNDIETMIQERLTMIENNTPQ